MSYLGRKRKPKSKALKRPLRAPSMQLDHIMCEHGECQDKWYDDKGFIKTEYIMTNKDFVIGCKNTFVTWRNDAKDLTLWARFVKWLRGWHG